MTLRTWTAAAVAATLVGVGCGADVPGTAANDSPLAYTQRARLVDVELVPFVATDLWLVALAERPGDPHVYAIAQQGGSWAWISSGCPRRTP